MNKITRFEDIPKFSSWGNYAIDIGIDYLPKWLDDQVSENSLNLDPDFQRIHVWTQEQKISYVEFVLRGGKFGNVFLFNCPGYMLDFKGPFELIDGKQRISALLDFFDNRFRVFGSYLSEFEDKIRRVDYYFKIIINNLKTRKEVLQWYIDLNTGGTPHSKEEIDRVKTLLEKE